MSPDIEWRVGEEAEQETIARVTSGKSSRWRKPLIVLVAVLGLGLGVLYASIPEPARPSAPPTPSATPLPPAPDLAQTIAEESRALASGDMQTLLGLLDPEAYAWRQEQISSYTPWGAPPSENEFYRVLSVQRLDAEHASADAIQYRSGKYFRETRFYRLLGEEWVRTPPVSGLAGWGDPLQIGTRYFQLTHYEADQEQARLLALYLAQQSSKTCRIFDCNFEEHPPVVNFILQADLNEAQQHALPGAATLTVTLPSPRLTGYTTTDISGVDVEDDNWDRYFAGYLYFPLLSTAIGGLERWDQQRDGLMYMFAVGLWDLSRRKQSLVGLPEFPLRSELMTGTVSLTADEMWLWPQDITEADEELRLSRACALVQFIDETYGADTVLRFFRTLRFAQSLPHALSRLGIPYDEIETKWQAWSSREVTRRPNLSN